MCWAWDEWAGSMCWKRSDTWLIFCPRRAPMYLFPFSLFDLGYYLPTCSFPLLSSLIHNCILHFHLPCSPIAPLTYEKKIANIWCTYLLRTSKWNTLSPSVHLPEAFKCGYLVLITFLQRQTRQQVYQRSDTLTSLSLTNTIYFGPTWSASLAWFVGDGGNN